MKKKKKKTKKRHKVQVAKLPQAQGATDIIF
jgi:hypothetical protein